jgi:hypothetical protein
MRMGIGSERGQLRLIGTFDGDQDPCDVAHGHGLNLVHVRPAALGGKYKITHITISIDPSYFQIRDQDFSMFDQACSKFVDD